MPSELVVYIPSYGNFEGALSQVKRLRLQASNLQEAPWSRVRLVVSVNGSPYDVNALTAAGAQVIKRHTNLEGDTNIALGFLEASPGDFLWVLSDNDPVGDSALLAIASAFDGADNVDMVIGVSDSTLEGRRSLRSPVTALGGSFHVGLISAVVYRWSSFLESTPAAFQALWTGWSQIALQERAVERHGGLEVACIPLSEMVTLTRGDQSARSVERARQAYTHSFYGGALLGFITTELNGKDGREAVSAWWRDHWLFASAYRPRSSWPARNFRATLVESVVRTGSPRDRALWLLSLPPYWRVGLWLRRRGIRLRRWN